jgi:gas vesicle structural protein
LAIAQRYVAQQQTGRGGPSGLADVLEVLLDKGLVIDAFVRVSLVGIELLTIDARVVVASVDTYLRFAEAVNRLDLLQASNSQTLGDLVGGSTGGGGRRGQRGGEGVQNGSRRQELSAGRSQRGTGPRSEEPSGRDGEREPAGGQASGGDDERSDRQPSGRSDEGERSGEEPSEGGLLSRIKQRGQAF